MPTTTPTLTGIGTFTWTTSEGAQHDVAQAIRQYLRRYLDVTGTEVTVDGRAIRHTGPVCTLNLVMDDPFIREDITGVELAYTRPD